MTTIEAPRPTTHTTNHSDVSHGVHVPCQRSNPYVIAICGTHLNWDDEQPATDETCVVCADLRTCPVCGVKVVMPA